MQRADPAVRYRPAAGIFAERKMSKVRSTVLRDESRATRVGVGKTQKDTWGQGAWT